MDLCIGVINQLLTWTHTEVLYVNQDTTNNKRIEMAYIDYGEIASCKKEPRLEPNKYQPVDFLVGSIPVFF